MNDYERGRADERAEWVRVVGAMREMQKADYWTPELQESVSAAEVTVDALLASAPKDAQGREREALERIKYKATSLADAQVIALEALAHPPAQASARELTDAEIDQVAQTNLGDCEEGTWHRQFARAILAEANAILAAQGGKP